jgi:hypothetical protein
VENLAEIVVDEWLIEYLSPQASPSQVELAHSITHLIKIKCDKLIFTEHHFARFNSKAKSFVQQAKNSFHYPMLLHPLTLLLYDSNKVERRSATHPKEIEGVKEDDFPVLDSAFAVSTQNKILITTDRPLSLRLAKYQARYGLACVTPDDYLASSL